MYEITQRLQMAHQAPSTGNTKRPKPSNAVQSKKEEKSLVKVKERLGLKKHLQISHYYEVT